MNGLRAIYTIIKLIEWWALLCILQHSSLEEKLKILTVSIIQVLSIQTYYLRPTRRQPAHVRRQPMSVVKGAIDITGQRHHSISKTITYDTNIRCDYGCMPRLTKRYTNFNSIDFIFVTLKTCSFVIYRFESNK